MTRTALALLVALALPASALARDYGDDRHDRRETRKDRRALHDDLRDAQLAEQLLRDFENTWAALDRNAVRGVELRVQAALEDELREADREAREAAHELRHDRREARDDRRDDRRDLPGDRRELADDRQDMMRAADYRARIEAVRNEWAGLRDQRTYPAMTRKHALLEELVRLSRVQIQSDVQELRDDANH